MKSGTTGQTLIIDMAEDEVIDETDAALPAAAISAEAEVIEGDDGADKKPKLPDRAIRNKDGSVTLPLTEEVTYTVKSSTGTHTEKVDQLVFRPLYGADLRIMAQQSDEMKGPVTFARATRIATNRMVVIFDKLRDRDVIAGGDIISFLSK